jgi:hypothetical protein
MKKLGIIVLILILIFIIFCLGVILYSKKCHISSEDIGREGGNEALTPSDLDWIIPQTDPNNITTLTTGEEISSELISISVKDGVSRDEVEEIVNGIGGVIKGELPDINAYYIKFSPPKIATEIETIIDELRANSSIDTASPEYIYEFNKTNSFLAKIERTFCKIADFLRDTLKISF